LQKICEPSLPIALLETHPAPRVEKLDVVSNGQIVERDSGNERGGTVGLAPFEEHMGVEPRTVRGCCRKLPQRRRFDEREIFLS
jgi:hypothetical protein